MCIHCKDPELSYSCLDCKVCTNEINEYYMVHDRLWARVNPDIKGMLCIGCIEKRLGRTLNKSDFIKAPVNHIGGMFDHSPRLLDRLTNNIF